MLKNKKNKKFSRFDIELLFDFFSFYLHPRKIKERCVVLLLHLIFQ